MITGLHVVELVNELRAEREPLVQRVVADDENIRQLQDQLVALQMATQSQRSRLLVIDQALAALEPLLPTQVQSGTGGRGPVGFATATAGGDASDVARPEQVAGQPPDQPEPLRDLSARP